MISYNVEINKDYIWNALWVGCGDFYSNIKGSSGNNIPLLNYCLFHGWYDIANQIFGDYYLNVKDSHGVTPLHVAVFTGNRDWTQKILAANASPNPITLDGKTPLDLAVDMQNTEIMLLLNQYGAKTSAQLKANNACESVTEMFSTLYLNDAQSNINNNQSANVTPEDDDWVIVQKIANLQM